MQDFLLPKEGDGLGAIRAGLPYTKFWKDIGAGLVVMTVFLQLHSAIYQGSESFKKVAQKQWLRNLCSVIKDDITMLRYKDINSGCMKHI